MRRKISMLKLNHKNLIVWKMSLKFVKLIYQSTENFPKSELFGITSQIRRAAVSVTSNIAEGASRKTTKERIRFFQIARSSLVEIDSQLTIAIELGYLNDEYLKELENYLNEIFAMLSGLITKS